MSEIIHGKVSNKKTLPLPILNKIFKRKKIPEELDIVIIDKKSQEYVEKVLGWLDFDDELLDKVNRLETEQWLSD
jgi:hypothetical protein